MVGNTKRQQRRKEECERLREREIKLTLLVLALKEDTFHHSGKEEEGKTFHKLHILRIIVIIIKQQ